MTKNIYKLIAYYKSIGRSKIDIGSYGHDATIIFSKNQWKYIIGKLRNNGFKVVRRVNGHKLILAYIISWNIGKKLDKFGIETEKQYRATT